MILEFLMNAVQAALVVVFSVLPSLPPIPGVITNIVDWFLNIVRAGTSVLSYVYGQPLFLALIAAIVALILFDQIYHGVMWILRKIPFVGIK